MLNSGKFKRLIFQLDLQMILRNITHVSVFLVTITA